MRHVIALAVLLLIGCDTSNVDQPTTAGAPPSPATGKQSDTDAPKVNSRPQVASDAFASVADAISALTLATEAQFDEDRYKATEWLVMQGDAAVMLLAEEVADDRTSSRSQIVIARILGRIGTDSASSVLGVMTGAKDQMGAINAIQRLGAIKPCSTDTINTLIELLNHDDDRRRLEAVKALGSIGKQAEAAGDQLIAIQNSQENDALRKAARRALETVKPRKTLAD